MESYSLATWAKVIGFSMKLTAVLSSYCRYLCRPPFKSEPSIQVIKKISVILTAILPPTQICQIFKNSRFVKASSSPSAAPGFSSRYLLTKLSVLATTGLPCSLIEKTETLESKSLHIFLPFGVLPTKVRTLSLLVRILNSSICSS